MEEAGALGAVGRHVVGVVCVADLAVVLGVALGAVFCTAHVGNFCVLF